MTEVLNGILRAVRQPTAAKMATGFELGKLLGTTGAHLFFLTCLRGAQRPINRCVPVVFVLAVRQNFGEDYSGAATEQGPRTE
jgi:hypothetical protein